MRKIPTKMREEMASMPYYTVCARQLLLRDHTCRPNPVTGKRIEWEHALIFGGKQVNEIWAIIPLCWGAHEGPDKKKEINVWIALNRATDEELKSYSKAVDLKRERDRLNKKYTPCSSSSRQ